MEYVDLETDEVFNMFGLQQRFSRISGVEWLTAEQLENTDENSTAYIPREPNHPIAFVETTVPTFNSNLYVIGNYILDKTQRPVQKTFELTSFDLEVAKDNLRNAARDAYITSRALPLNFNGGSFNLDDQFRITKQMEMIDRADTSDKIVKILSNNNQFVQLDEDDQVLFAEAILAAERSLFDYYHTIFEQIDDAQEISDLEALNLHGYTPPVT